VAVCAVIVAITAAPNASAEPVANCTSDVIDGVDVDTCVCNHNYNTLTDVPGVNMVYEFNFGIGFGF
jgi:pantoate kinase